MNEQELNQEAIKTTIRSWLKVNALGRENAKPRRHLLRYLQDVGCFTISDRRLRRLYADMTVGYACRNPKGIFWIRDDVPGDLDSLIDSQKRRAVSCFIRAQNTREETERNIQPEIPGTGRP